MYKAYNLISANGIFPDGFLFKEGSYTAEMCITEASRGLAFHLRYKAYLNAAAITSNPSELFTDPYDEKKNARTYLIRYEGSPVASVRSLTWSADYDWTQTPFLEINRYVVDPDFQGLRSLTAQMLLYRIQALSTLADACDHVIAAVRPRHVAFYRRLMNFEVISDPISVPDVNFQIQLMTTPASSHEKLARSCGMTVYQETDLKRYRRCLYRFNGK